MKAPIGAIGAEPERWRVVALPQKKVTGLRMDACHPLGNCVVWLPAKRALSAKLLIPQDGPLRDVTVCHCDKCDDVTAEL